MLRVAAQGPTQPAARQRLRGAGATAPVPDPRAGSRPGLPSLETRSSHSSAAADSCLGCQAPLKQAAKRQPMRHYWLDVGVRIDCGVVCECRQSLKLARGVGAAKMVKPLSHPLQLHYCSSPFNRYSVGLLSLLYISIYTLEPQRSDHEPAQSGAPSTPVHHQPSTQ